MSRLADSWSEKTRLVAMAAACSFVLSTNTNFAIAAATRSVTLVPHNQQQEQARQLVLQGSQLMKANKPFRARPLLEQAVALWGDSPYIRFTLGCCYSEVGEFNKAINEYELALQGDNSLTDCLPNIASCYQLMGQPQQAIMWFDGYLRRNPHSPDSAMIRGMVAALQKQAARQVQSDPNSSDYLDSIIPSGHLQRWQSDRLPIKIFISQGRDEHGNAVPGFREYYNLMLLDAMDTWVKASKGKLGYILVDDASTADIVCTWTHRRDFLEEQGNGVEQGVARVASRPVRGKDEIEIAQVRVIILLVDTDGRKNISDEEMKKTCLHELGHALGFAGHSTNNKDVMFFSNSPTVWASLTKRDKATMARLYYDYPDLGPTADSTQYGFQQQSNINPSYGQQTDGFTQNRANGVY